MSVRLDESRTYWYQLCVNAWQEGLLVDESSHEQVTEVILIILGSKYWERLFDKDKGEEFFSKTSKYIPRKVLISISKNIILNKALENMIGRGEVNLSDKHFSLNKREATKSSIDDHNIYESWYGQLGASRYILLENQIRIRFLHSLPSPQLTLLLRENRPLLENVHLQKMIRVARQEIIDGTNKLYDFLLNPSTITTSEQILILEALFKGRIKGSSKLIASPYYEKLFPGDITFLTLLHDWSSFSDANKQRVDELYKEIPHLKIFSISYQEDGDRTKFYIDFPKDLTYQEFVIEICLKLFACNFKQKWGWVPDMRPWPDFLKQEEFRGDFMIGLVFDPELLQKSVPSKIGKPKRYAFPIYQAAHPLIESHRLFLQVAPCEALRVSEGKESASASVSQSRPLGDAYKKLYQMIQDRDTALEYYRPERIPIKMFSKAYETFSKYENEVNIEKKKAYFLFLTILDSENEKAFEIAKKISKKVGGNSLAFIFPALLIAKNIDAIELELFELLSYPNLQLNGEEIAKIIGLYPRFKVAPALATLRNLQAVVDGYISEYPNTMWEYYKTLIKDNSFTFLLALSKEKGGLEYFVRELVSLVNVLDQLEGFGLNKIHFHQLYFSSLEKKHSAIHLMSGSVAFVKSVSDYLNITLSTKDTLMILRATPDFTPWNKALEAFAKVKEVILEDTNFSIDPETYRQLEEAILLLKKIPKVSPEFEDGFERLSLQLQDDFKFVFFISYQHFLDNFHVKAIERESVIYSVNSKDTTDVQFDHSGRFSEIVPGTSIMTAWVPPVLGEYPYLFTCYLKQGAKGVSARFLFHKLNWSIFTDQYLTTTLNTSQSSRSLDSPFIDREKPPTEFQMAFFSVLRLFSKHVLLEGNTLSRVATLSKKCFTLPKEDPEDGTPNPSNEYPFNDDMLTAFSLLDHISSNISRARNHRNFSDIDSLEKEWLKTDQEQMSATLAQIFEKNLGKGSLGIIASYCIEPKTFSLQQEVFTFFDRLKKEATKTWRDIVFDRESKSSSAQVITTESLAEETWFDEHKIPHSFKRAVLQTTLIQPLTTKELTLDILYQAHKLIESSKNSFLGKMKRGKFEKISSQFINSEGTRQNGNISIISTTSDQEFKVILKVSFPGGRTYETRSFVYDKALLSNPQKFSNLFSLQLLLLKTLYHRKPYQ